MPTRELRPKQAPERAHPNGSLRPGLRIVVGLAVCVCGRAGGHGCRLCGRAVDALSPLISLRVETKEQAPGSMPAGSNGGCLAGQQRPHNWLAESRVTSAGQLWQQADCQGMPLRAARRCRPVRASSSGSAAARAIIPRPAPRHHCFHHSLKHNALSARPSPPL